MSRDDEWLININCVGQALNDSCYCYSLLLITYPEPHELGWSISLGQRIVVKISASVHRQHPECHQRLTAVPVVIPGMAWGTFHYKL